MCDALSRNLPQLPEKLEIIVGHCLAHARRRFVEVTPNFPEPCRYVLEALGEVYRNDARAQPMTRRAVTFPATAQRPGLGRTSRLAHRPVRGKESGAELRSGNGDPVSAQALGAAHAVSAAARGTSGQQHLRAGVEESHPASQKLFVLQDREWGSCRCAAFCERGPSMSTKKIETPQEIYQLKVTLLGATPPIWRRLLVPADMTLEQTAQRVATGHGVGGLSHA